MMRYFIMAKSSKFIALNIAILTISDSRSYKNDHSGHYLYSAIKKANHHGYEHIITPDNTFGIRAKVSQWIADPNVQVIITTGGTGFSERDFTPKAIHPLLEQPIEGFGELMRLLSIQEIQTSTIQSRTFAGFSNGCAIFCLPGATNACTLAWEKILIHQLNASNKPCNFVEHIKEASKNYEFI